MEKAAYVVAIEDDSLRVRLMRHSACAKCGACTMGENPETEVTLEYSPDLHGLQLKPGDQVILTFSSSAFLRGVFLVYLLPLLLSFLGYFLGYKVLSSSLSPGWQEGAGVLSGLIFLVLSYLGLNRYDRRLAGTERYQIKVKPWDPAYKE